jgi:hypothetical protein
MRNRWHPSDGLQQVRESTPSTKTQTHTDTRILDTKQRHKQIQIRGYWIQTAAPTKKFPRYCLANKVYISWPTKKHSEKPENKKKKQSSIVVCKISTIYHE